MGIRTAERTLRINSMSGVNPPSSMLAHNSRRYAQPPSAAVEAARETTATSSSKPVGIVSSKNATRQEETASAGAHAPFYGRLPLSALKNARVVSPRVARCVRLLAESSGLIPPIILQGAFQTRRPRMKTPKYIFAAGFAAMGIAIASCEKPYHQPEERYVLVTANVNLPYWQEAQAGLTDIGKTAGGKGEVEGPATLSPSEELSVFQKVVAQNPAGIMVSASDPALFKESINKAVLQGIPVSCMDSDSPDYRRALSL